MLNIPRAIAAGLANGQGLPFWRLEVELWNRDTSDCGVGETMCFNNDGANTTYVGIDEQDASTYKYGSVFKPTTANIFGLAAMALETVKAGKRGLYLIYGLTPLAKVRTVSASITAGHGYGLTLESTATGSSAAVDVVSGSAGANLYARPETGTNGFEAYTVPVYTYGTLQEATVDTTVAAKKVLFNGFGFRTPYGG